LYNILLTYLVQIIVETRVYGNVFVQPGVKVNGDNYREVYC